MIKMLLCETQTDLGEAIHNFFSDLDYSVESETNGLKALECLRKKQYDIVVMEMSLHALDGLSVLRAYRADGGSTPVLILTGNVTSEQLQRVFDDGADAYLSTPFQLADLAAHVRALLRRPNLSSHSVAIFRAGALSLDLGTGQVHKEGKLIRLFPMEFKLLHFLMSHPNQVFNTNAIFERVWQKSYGNADETVRTHIRTLRKKIDATGAESLISTVRGFGYQIAHRESVLCEVDNTLPNSDFEMGSN